MEAPLHQFPVPPPPLQLPLQQDAFLQQAVAARALMMSAAAGNKAPSPTPLATASGPGREQCPRCASRDTKFCYYNNYNTAQPRHFCRACRRYWTLGGSLRNVPIGGSTRKRPRPARPTRAMAAAVAAMATATPTTATINTSAGGGPFSSPETLQGAAGGGVAGLLLSSLLLGSVSAASASPLLAFGAAPLLEGRLSFDIDLGLGAGADSAAADMTQHHLLPLGAGPLPWPAETMILEGDRAETTMWTAASSAFPFPPAGTLSQELAAAAPVVEAGGLHHGGPRTCSCEAVTRSHAQEERTRT